MIALGMVASLSIGCGEDSAGDATGAGNSEVANNSPNNSPNNFDDSSNNFGGGFSDSPNNSPNNSPAPPDGNNSPDPGDNEPDIDEPSGNTNVNIGGAQDFGYFRRLVNDNRVPEPGQFDAAGFFAEHFTPLPQPTCGERVCLQAMMGVMGNLMDNVNCTMLQVGLNSPLVADPDDRPPLSLAVVVDVSGSMAADGKLNFVRQGLGQLIDNLYDDDEIAIVTYETRVNVLFEMAPIRGNRNALRDLVDGLRPEGSTNLYDGLERGYDQVFENYDSARQNRVILLSDGEPTAGITEGDAIVDMSRAYNSDGVGLTTVGLGTDFNFELMRDLAEQADGNFYFLEDAGAVEEVFTQEISYFTVPVAFDLELTMRTGTDYTFGRARGSRLWEDTEEGGRLEIPSVFLAHRVSADDVTDEGGRRGGGSALLLELIPRDPEDLQEMNEVDTADVATIDLSFREPGTNDIITEQIEVSVPFAPWDTPLRGFFENDIVTKSFVMLNIYVALEQSCALFHEGDATSAIVMLDRLIAAAEDYNDGVNEGAGDTDIEFDIQLMEDLIEVMLRNGGQSPEETEVVEDPWPAD